MGGKTRRSKSSPQGGTGGGLIYTGRAPKAILDLKAAIRYLRHFDKQMLGDAERIITDGTSAGGASVCFCPITDLDHAEVPELCRQHPTVEDGSRI